MWQNRQYVLTGANGAPHAAAVPGASRAPFRPDMVLEPTPTDRHIIVEVLEDSHRQSKLFYHPQNKVVQLLAIARAHLEARGCGLPAMVLVNIPRWNPSSNLKARVDAVLQVLDTPCSGCWTRCWRTTRPP